MPDTPRHEPAAPAAPRHLSLRGRVLAGLLVALALVMLVAGLVNFYLERGRLEDGVDAGLQQRRAQVLALAARGTDPVSGERLADIELLLRSAMQSALPGPDDGEVGLIDGRVALTAPDSTRVRPEEMPGLVAAAAADPQRARIDTFEGPPGTYRYIVIPVAVAGDPRPGTLVAVVDLGAQRARMESNYRTFWVVGFGSGLLVGLLAWLGLGHVLRPIGWLRRTAERISDRDLSERVPVRGHDDLAALTHTINAMLDRLEGTFDGQRRLLDDVGHELRTPLTVMRGHLELMNVHDPTDVRATRDVSLSEIDRTAALVEDLITLAKSERPDFVRPVEVDVADLTAEVLAKATALGDRQWGLDEVAEQDAWLDPHRVSQALLELARNAVKFSEPGSAVLIGSAVTGDRVDLWVRDHGRGIEPDRLSVVTERFARAADDVEGSGLGLAIVTSIARAHGGRLTIQSTPGEGSTFILDLPRATPPGAATIGEGVTP